MSLEPAERFLAWLQIEQGRADKTIEAYRRDLRDYEDWLSSRGKSSMNASSADVEAFVAHLRKHGKAARSVARQFAAVRMLHKYLAIEGERADDPASLVDGVRVPSGLPKPLREDEIERLLASITGDDSFARRDRAPGATPASRARRSAIRRTRSTGWLMNCACRDISAALRSST